MNQQLLNINTVINPDTRININDDVILGKITSVVNNTSHARYKIIKYLGKGIYGNLYLAIDANGNRVICKEILLDSDSSNNAIQIQQLEFELNILKYLSNNIVAKEHINPCLEYKIHNNYVYTIFPVFKGYSLGHFHGYMLKLQQKDWYYKITFFLIKSILHALAKIHDTGIAHQNITSNSILVSTFIEPDKIKVKFTDFGLGCGCPKDLSRNSNTLIPWKQYEILNKIGNCKENNNTPVKYISRVLELLKDSDYLKISQKYDILCIGLIIIKLLLFLDTELIVSIDELLSDMHDDKLEILRDEIKSKYFKFDNKNNESSKQIIIEYLKLIFQYMISPIIKRRPVQYVLDKIIIYEKYKNDIF